MACISFSWKKFIEIITIPPKWDQKLYTEPNALILYKSDVELLDEYTAQKNKMQWRTRQIWGIWKLRPAYSPETPNLGQNRWCLVPCDLEIWWMTLAKQ